MTATPPPASLRDRIEHALRIAAVPWATNMLPLTQHGEGGHRFETGCSLCHGDAPSLTDAARAAGMRDAAAMLRRHCPKHDVHSGRADTAFMSCHCPGADEIDRDANALAARTPTS